jgi:CRP/FNR family cyclic AMP-dependent transcriptional regulator
MSSIPTERQYRPGQFLFREGEPSNCMYLIKKGTVAIRKMKGQDYVELGKVYSNEVLGELSFFDRKPRSAAAVALTEVEVLEISFTSLDAIYTKVPDYLKTIMASVADRLRKANDMIRKLQHNVVTEDGHQEQLNPEQMSAAEALESTTLPDPAPKVDETAAPKQDDSALDDSGSILKKPHGTKQ